MEVELCGKQLEVSSAVTTLLGECSAVTDYRTLRDSLPRRLAGLLKCRCVLLYQRIGETLQFASGSFDDQPGWSAELLAVAHINPVNLSSDVPEVRAWCERHGVYAPAAQPTLAALPLIYRQRAIGVLTVAHPIGERGSVYWRAEDMSALEAVAGVVALLLENTRLLERDRERIHELSLLNSISSQINCSLYERERMRSVVIQRAREITNADLCELLTPEQSGQSVPWITPELQKKLFQRFREARSLVPLVLERPGDMKDPEASRYLEQLPAYIKTFFVLPLLSGGALGGRGGPLLQGSVGAMQERGSKSKVLGIVVGGYHRAWKMRREEEVLLQVLASQASVVMENMLLVSEVVEARNEARKLLRQVLEDQRLKELILESMPSGLITTDRHAHITTFNRAAEVILGYHPYEVLGQPLARFLDLSSLRSALPGLLNPLPGQANALPAQVREASESGTVALADRQGQEIVLDVDVLPLHDDLGEQIGLLFTFTDVTSVHRLEEEKRRLDRLASLGEMAANVAHEVRNPLASIKTSIQMLKADMVSVEPVSLEQAEWVRESIEVMLKEVERLDAIVRDLLSFARPRKLHRVRCEIVELCDRVLDLIQPQCAAASVEVHRVYVERPTLWVDIGQIEQVLLNLFMNALQAMPDGGVLTITCQTTTTAASTRRDIQKMERLLAPLLQGRKGEDSALPKGLPEQRWVEIAVSDTGMGVPPEQVERIFQPFFTTKAHGIGLGLPITRRLVEDHGGSIRVEGQFGYGATIVVRLPILKEEQGLAHDVAWEKSEGGR